MLQLLTGVCALINTPFPAQRLVALESRVDQLNATNAILGMSVSDTALKTGVLETQMAQVLATINHLTPPPPSPASPPMYPNYNAWKAALPGMQSGTYRRTWRRGSTFRG